MNVQPQVQAKLLDLAGVDAELTRIAHRRNALPEQQEVDSLEAERISRKDASVSVEIQIDDIDRDIRKLEGEIDAVRQREDKDRTLLQSGSVGAKQLTELEHELGSLVRRQGILEDELLEIMEQREALQADHDHAGAQLSQAEDELVDAKRRRDDAVADLNKAQERCLADRERLIGEFPADFLAVYEKQRAQGGPGAALLQARRCGACRIEIDRAEISRIAAAPSDSVVRCNECGAIMVRTKESGL
ncbi:zinc ribbon domain-containing protein [Rhodococcus sp. ARC_M6]|uniref:zinc ribbon domain-containing protein n=1 Tax=Rhodococcus sp. ARC_M6 TaxID=2928852 RepID=UPI001FB1E81F|nr:C4-type zinc ribbon domain-containing protein [Rhodococcus sp. ARC_M6]MCJ0903386.1 C4-type zinc ribbon domain-containing protein [Rhodococcus sp. ARC_M6]